MQTVNYSTTLAPINNGTTSYFSLKGDLKTMKNKMLGQTVCTLLLSAKHWPSTDLVYNLARLVN